MDPELGDKRKCLENIETSRKKRKIDGSFGIVGLTNDDYNMVLDGMEEVANQSCWKIDEFHTESVSNVTNLLQVLCTIVKEVRVAVDQEPYLTMLLDQASPFEE